MFYFFFYFPFGLDVRGSRPAWATYGLAAAAGLGYVVAALAPAWFWEHVKSFVYIPAAPSGVALVASAFVHGDLLHLLSNLLALWVFGTALEARLGSRWTVALFFLCHVAGNLVQGALALALGPAAAAAGVIGASGAIAGLIGVVLVRLHFARLRVAYWAFMPLQVYTRAGTRTLPVQAAVLLWLLVQAGLAFAQSQGGQTSIAVGAHAGGLLGGIGIALAFGLRRLAGAEAILRRGRSYVAQASWYPAQGEFLAYVQRWPQDPAGHLELARTLRLTGRGADADAHYRTACARLADLRAFDRVEEVHAEAVRANPDFGLDPVLQLAFAKMLERCCKPDAAESVYRQLVRLHPTAPETAVALFRIARLRQARGDADAARAAYTRLLCDHPDAAEADMARLALAAEHAARRAAA